MALTKVLVGVFVCLFGFFSFFLSKDLMNYKLLYWASLKKGKVFILITIAAHVCFWNVISRPLKVAVKPVFTKEFYSSLLCIFWEYLYILHCYKKKYSNKDGLENLLKYLLQLLHANTSCEDFILLEQNRLLKKKARDWRWKICKRRSNVKGKIIVLCFDSPDL